MLEALSDDRIPLSVLVGVFEVFLLEAQSEFSKPCAVAEVHRIVEHLDVLVLTLNTLPLRRDGVRWPSFVGALLRFDGQAPRSRRLRRRGRRRSGFGLAPVGRFRAFRLRRFGHLVRSRNEPDHERKQS